MMGYFAICFFAGMWGFAGLWALERGDHGRTLRGLAAERRRAETAEKAAAAARAERDALRAEHEGSIEPLAQRIEQFLREAR